MELLTKSRPRREARNTYRLPRGEPIRRELKAWFRRQRDAVRKYLATGKKAEGHDPLGGIPDWDWFGLGDLPMSERMTPLLEAIWDKQGRQFTSRIGLDPDVWAVTNPKTRDAIDQAALDFCSATNQTTSLSITEAMAQTRQALAAGLIAQGESIDDLTRRIGQIFDGAETWRARRIAASEASRATHAAQEMAGAESGVVTGWEWLLSEDACPLCQTVGRRARFVRMGQPFAVVGDHPTYSTIRHPPLHPGCQCSLAPVLDIDRQPKWADTLVQPEPEEQDREPGDEPGEKSRACRIALALKSHAPKRPRRTRHDRHPAQEL